MGRSREQGVDGSATESPGGLPTPTASAHTGRSGHSLHHSKPAVRAVRRRKCAALRLNRCLQRLLEDIGSAVRNARRCAMWPQPVAERQRLMSIEESLKQEDVLVAVVVGEHDFGFA
jgi:hypothetical protein